jgi:hypothetical protein
LISRQNHASSVSTGEQTKREKIMRKYTATELMKGNVSHTMDQILWDFGQCYGEKLPRSTRKDLSQEQIAICALRAFEKTGFAIRHADAEGNLTWKATPEMQAYDPDAMGGTVTIRAPSFDREE